MQNIESSSQYEEWTKMDLALVQKSLNDLLIGSRLSNDCIRLDPYHNDGNMTVTIVPQ